MNTAALLAFIKERHAIYLRRKAKQPWPWTNDPILREYRFCNVYRNLDKETALIHKNWLFDKSRPVDPDAWFAMTVARLVNWWPSLEEVGYPVPWSPKRFTRALDGRKARGEKVFTGAYMIRADRHPFGKPAYLAEEVLSPLWEAREEVRPRAGDSLDDFHQRLLPFKDIGSFMAGQIVADTKYAPGGWLKVAKDWKTWACSGPGSQRGLNRVLGMNVDSTWNECTWRANFSDLHADMVSLVKEAGLPYITGQDLQNCLCEFDKYERVRLGEGRPRSLYHPPSQGAK